MQTYRLGTFASFDGDERSYCCHGDEIREYWMGMEMRWREQRHWAAGEQSSSLVLVTLSPRAKICLSNLIDLINSVYRFSASRWHMNAASLLKPLQGSFFEPKLS